MRFASDNTAGAAPEIMAAMAAANEGAAMGYGADPITKRVEARLAEVFERPCDVFLVTTGTAANALALASMVPPWGSVLCHRGAHIEVDECGAPEFYSGAKLALLDGDHGRIPEAALRRALVEQGAGGVHQAQPKALSLTQATEAGALYTPLQVANLAEIARGGGLRVHMDGTRFANALARTNASPADLSWRAGVDVLCLGATKNGAVAAEAIICFDRTVAEGLAYRRKRGGHLLSKMRFVAAQVEAWLADDLCRNHVLGAHMMVDGSMSKHVVVPASGTVQFPTDTAVSEGLFFFDLVEPEAMKNRLNAVSMDNWVHCVDEALRKSGQKADGSAYSRDDIDFLNMVLIKPSGHAQMVERLDLTEDQSVYLHDIGHTGEQDAMFSIREGLKQGRLKDGDLMAIVAAGIGYVWAAGIVQWGEG